MAELLMRREWGALRPLFPDGEDLLSGIPQGETLKVTFTRPRNVQFHKLFFALMNLALENQDRYENMDHLLTAVKVAVGYADTVILRTGETAFIPKSISFAKMDEDEFRVFFNRVVDVVLRDILPEGNTRSALLREVHEMLGIPQSMVDI